MKMGYMEEMNIKRNQRSKKFPGYFTLHGPNFSGVHREADLPGHLADRYHHYSQDQWLSANKPSNLEKRIIGCLLLSDEASLKICGRNPDFGSYSQEVKEGLRIARDMQEDWFRQLEREYGQMSIRAKKDLNRLQETQILATWESRARRLSPPCRL